MNVRIFFAVILIAFLSGIAFSALTGCGGDAAATVTMQVLTADGTEKSFDDTPIPLNIRIKLTFSSAVDPTSVASDLIFTANGLAVPYSIAWQADNTEAIITPRDLLTYGTEYRVAIGSDQLSSSVDVPVSTTTTKASAAATEGNFTTMLNSDLNGDGMADLITGAPNWAGGSTGEGGTGRGRGYLFYGNTALASGSATTAAAIIDGVNNDDTLFAVWSSILDNDLNDDGYADAFYVSQFYSGDAGRTYIFYGGSGDTPISGTMSADAADVLLTGAAPSDFFLGITVGDVNGDGYSDLIGSARGCSGNTGCLYVFLGPNIGSQTAAEADATITGETAGDLLGVRVRIGDVNGDGLRDIVAAAVAYPAPGGNGRIYVFYGRDEWSSMNASEADVTITGEAAANALFVETLEDINGDGIKDILGAARGYDGGKGRAYVFYGGGLATGSASEADLIFTNDAGTDLFGWEVITGDVNGDGTVDILVDARGYPGGGNQGRIYGFLGGEGLASKDAGSADFYFTGENGGDQFESRAIGDVNADGIVDVIADAQFYPQPPGEKGRVYVFFGGSSIATKGAGSADVIIDGENDGDHLGFHRLIDFNGDGVMDIVGGASTYTGGNATGREYLFFGSSSLASASAAAADSILDGENHLDDFGE